MKDVACNILVKKKIVKGCCLLVINVFPCVFCSSWVSYTLLSCHLCHAWSEGRQGGGRGGRGGYTGRPVVAEGKSRQKICLGNDCRRG